jgi:hypothetical protein
MRLMHAWVAGAVVSLCVSVCVPATAAAGSSTYNAMWLSIARPGLGEWYLKNWGSFERCPQKKFWLGMIPLYGWPGYLQVKSAIDARNGRTNDDLTFGD